MRTYSKRIGFLVSSQTLIPHGGIGQFCKSFCELMDKNDVKVDIITDKEPNNIDFIKTLKANIISPLESLRYNEHSSIFMYNDTFNYERMVNFRNSIIRALEHNLYDCFICNTYESIQVALTMGIEDVVQIIAYTHLESQIFKDTKNPFLDSTNDMMRKQLECDNLYIGTQSLFNKSQFTNAWHLPIPVTESTLLEEHHKNREGVLFIGRWENGKNPELFLELIEQSKLPAKVMTSPNGVKKFSERLEKLGVKYDVRSSIVGKEKVDFITSSRIAFNPSLVESYGMAFYEQIIQLPTFCLDNQRWTKNFDGHTNDSMNFLFFKTNKKDMVSDVLVAYNTFANSSDWYNMGSLAQARQNESLVFEKWNECFNHFKPKQSNNNSAKICSEETIKLHDYISKLNRDVICIDDIHSVFTNRNKFITLYTDDNTYLTKDTNFKPTEQVNENLFEF